MANLLDSFPMTAAPTGLLALSPEEQQQAKTLGLLALASGMIRGDFGGGLAGFGQAYQSAQDNATKNKLQEIQAQDLLQQVDLRKQQAAQLQRRNDMINGWLGQLDQSVPQANQAVIAQTGNLSPTIGNAALQTQATQRLNADNPIAGIPRSAITADLAFNDGKNIAEWMFKRGTPNIQFINGVAVDTNRTNAGESLPQMSPTGQGYQIMRDPSAPGGYRVTVPQGALDAYRGFKQADADIAAQNDLVQVYNQATKQMEFLPRSRVLGRQPTPNAPSVDLPPAQPGVTGNFVGDPAPVIAAIMNIKDPQERSNALAAFNEQARRTPGFAQGAGFAAGAPIRTEGQKSTDEAFGKDYSQWVASGGFTDQLKQLDQLSVALNALKTDSSLTGPWVGMLPDSVRTKTNPQAVNIKNLVEDSVQRSLRPILGAQFTENEGNRLIARAYNPQLSTEDNVARLDRLVNQLKVAAQTKADAAKYYEQNGTLAGWQGKLPTFSDFNLDGKTSSGKVGDATGARPLPSNPSAKNLQRGERYTLPDGRIGTFDGMGFKVE